MSVLKSYFNFSVNQNSPVFDDYLLVEKVDKDGGIVMVPEKVDYPEIQKSHGSVEDWSLSNLLKAGINPGSFSIHTGYNTKLDGVSAINDVAADIDVAISEMNTVADVPADTDTIKTDE